VSLHLGHRNVNRTSPRSHTCVFLAGSGQRRRRPLFRRRFRLRLALRIALAFARRRCSLLDTNHRFLRTALRIPALATALRHRFNNSSCDSPALRLTDKLDTSILQLVLHLIRATAKLGFPSTASLPGGAAESTAHPSLRSGLLYHALIRASQASSNSRLGSEECLSATSELPCTDPGPHKSIGTWDQRRPQQFNHTHDQGFALPLARLCTLRLGGWRIIFAYPPRLYAIG
jgi:hypothetical protein